MTILVAKAVAAEMREGEVSLLSTETTMSPASFTQDELFTLSVAYSNIYANLIETLVPMLVKRGVPAAAARVVLRDAVPSVVHLVLDRALRLSRFVAARGNVGLAVSSPPSPEHSSRPEGLRARAVSSREFNEYVLGHLAPALGLPQVAWTPSPRLPDPPVTIGAVNYNFEGRGLWRKVRGRVFKTLARFWPGRAPALGLSYATYILQDSGFFGFGLLEFVRGRATFPASRPEPAAREELEEALANFAVHFEAFFTNARAGGDAKALAKTAVKLIAEVFPSDALEGAAELHRVAAALLAAFPRTALVLSETANVEATFLLAAARADGVETIGVQEGGHYGYEDDYVAGYEMEYPHFDRYLTWGWTRFPEGRGMGQVKAVVLPSPWLSVRRRQWKRDVSPGPGWWERERPHDLLLMSNKIYPYPPAPSGGAVSRSDHSPAFSAELKVLVTGAKLSGVKILHKSFNTATMQLLAGTLADLRELGGDCYTHVTRLDKGMHPALIGQVRMVLWDQPGTGFLECLTAGLPTMVLWSRLYNREVPWSREAFAALERVGLVHRESASALAEYARYKDAPTEWMRDKRRTQAVVEFCAQYALTDDNWQTQWMGQLRAACSRR